MKRIATTFARFVGLAVFAYGGVILIGHVMASLGDSTQDSPLLLALVMLVAMSGMAGAITYLLSIDGPSAYRTRGRRALGWAGMLMCASLPTGALMLMAPLVLVSAPTLLMAPEREGRRRGRHLATSG